MKTKFIYIVLGVLFFAGTSAFGQEKYTDKEIGFDVAKLSKKLEKRGYKKNDIEGIVKEERENALLIHKEILNIEKEYELKNSFKNSNNSQQRMAGCINDLPQIEKDALVALYNATNGVGWNNNSGWLDFNVCDWYGVTIQNNRVVSLSLGGNNLTGNIPTSLGNLSQIGYFNLGSNNLSGAIPNPLGSLVNVTYFRLSNNNLTGVIPESLGSFQQVNYFDLRTNNLSGSIPSTLGNFRYVEYFNLSNNSLTGSIPSTLGNLNSVVTFDIMSNNLTESIPSELGDLTNVERLYLQSNELSNSIPASIGSLTNVKQLGLSDNELTGTIPSEIALLQNVELVWLSINNLTGEVPEELAYLNINKLTSIQFYINNLSGDLPDFSQFTLISHLRFYENKFRFINFEENYNVFYDNIVDYDFAPQDLIDEEITANVVEDQSYTFVMFTDNYYSNNNTYQWYKGVFPNGVAISGATNRTYTKTNLSIADAGDYYCLAGNTVVNGTYDYQGQYYSNYKLQRRPIHLIVNDDSDPCDEVHVALVIDESSSIMSEFPMDISEAQQIRNGLHAFIDNELNSNMSISLIGMSNSDYDQRTDHIIETKVNLSTKPLFDTWIDEYRNRDGEPGVNYSSDFWASGLEAAINLDNTPDIVIVITDGSQVQNEDTLKSRMNTINNTSHLYVYGIDFGSYYPNGGQLKSSSQNANPDPNNPKTSGLRSSSSAISLEDSLLYLLERDPISSQTNILSADFYGYDTFLDLNTGLSSMSNTLSDSAIGLGSWTIGTTNGQELCTNENLTFNLQTNAAITSYSWTFFDIDGANILNSVQANPTISFPAAETYSLTLIVTYGQGCTATLTQDLEVLDCDPCDTVAILVDESGSLDEDEIEDIREGLSRFISDQMDSGLNISIIGMSDSDGRLGIDSVGNIRTDHIIGEKVTSATKPMFDQWIDNFGIRYEDNIDGISGSSDYWASALTVVNNSEYIPELVVILTDGSQTADIDYLQEQINLVRTNSNLYVYGIDNEYYVNSDNVNARLSRDQDPNYSTIERSQKVTFNNSSAREVVASIRTSLDYLFGTTDADEPISGQENLINADYYGYDDFTGLTGLYGTELGILSNLLAHSGIECTATIDECYACYTFQPEPGNQYWLSGWVKEDLNIQVKTYENTSIRLHFIDASDNIIDSKILYPSGNIIDGWQRIAGQFDIPSIPINTVTLDLELVNSSDNIPVYFDDIRVHPVNGSMKSFVYDPITYRLMAELDENNYGTYYEYDNEGGLVRVKKETSRGVKTIQETRSGNVINNDN